MNDLLTRRAFAHELAEICSDDGGDSGGGGDTPDFPPDPSVMLLQGVMQYNGYWGDIDGKKSPEFFEALRTFTDDMEKC